VSPEHEALIRITWAEIAPRAGELTDQFYRTLFEVDPAVRALFGHTDRTALGRKLGQTLDEIVKVLDEPERLVSVLAPLGRHHAGYGVDRRHYDAGATALIAALRCLGSPRFTSEAEEAWRELYRLVAAVMERGGALAVSREP
jgi:hemoglobin-like flavoprotein